MSHCQTAKGQSQPLTENTRLGQRMRMNWRAGTMVAAGALASQHCKLQTGKGTRENVLQALVRGIWGLGLWLGAGALF